ncbi:hypothetical protein [Paenibacillus tianjinensis]|uniref:YhfM-like domain-containing protein n=1 Tax=Paenibacillus tianjinensis TaxID=2810347 RepID=A0ABX7LIZ6_9BACL|nr:hypothetical protein [Paenibacillus tianjinensis]QSF46949.1 hypothetical protein JRJ22_10505 [Paenibacillus tianjinensis]
MPLLLIVLLTGCQNAYGFINARWITDIYLEYIPLDREQKEAPFESKTFTDVLFIKDMADAMNKSKRIPGDLDYDYDFRMKLTFGDGYTEEYIVNLGRDSGNPGLLLSAERSSTVYTIPVEYADRLRTAIFVGGDQTAADAEVAKVTLDSPFTLSRNPLPQVTGRPEFLNMELIDGKYSEDWTALSPIAGRKWSGQFRLTVTGEQGDILSTYPLSRQYRETLEFGSFFQIEFGDYNGDGNPDFTIGQYGSSNGNVFKLFTLNIDRSIEELPINRTPELFVSASGRYSVKLTETEGGFKVSQYNNSLGKQVEITYRWIGSAFQKVQ